MLRVWGHRKAPNVAKVIWGLAEIGLPYLLVETGGPFGGTDTASYLAMNPNGRIPTIEDGGFVLWESHAILRYLARRADARTLYPEERWPAAIVDQWLDWQGAHLAQAVRELVRLTVRASSAPAPDILAPAGSEAQRLFAIADAAIAREGYLAGPDFTIADIPVGVAYQRWMTLPVGREPLAHLDAWFARVSERPGFAVLRT